jgi:hypothetical protein
VSRAAEALRLSLEQIALDVADHESELRRLTTARQRVESALLALGEDPEQPSDAELEEFRPADQARVWSQITDQLTAADLPSDVRTFAGAVVVDHTPLTPAEGVPCPDCGSVFTTLQGMRGHRGRMHKVSAPPAPPTSPPIVARAHGGVVLACTDCDAEFETSKLTELVTHTRRHHGRRPTDAERMPVNQIRGAA